MADNQVDQDDWEAFVTECDDEVMVAHVMIGRSRGITGITFEVMDGPLKGYSFDCEVEPE